MQTPLARTVCGGLMSSTLITLILIPVIYVLFNKNINKKNLPEKISWYILEIKLFAFLNTGIFWFFTSCDSYCILRACFNTCSAKKTIRFNFFFRNNVFHNRRRAGFNAFSAWYAFFFVNSYFVNWKLFSNPAYKPERAEKMTPWSVRK